MSSTENEVKKAILDYLKYAGVFAWRNNTGAFLGSHKGKTRFFRFGDPGSSDIFIIHRGIFYAIEVKRPGKIPTFEQEAWMERVRHRGGKAEWFDNIDSFVAYWEREDS